MATTFYLGKVLDASLLTTANDVSTASGATQVGQDTRVDGSTGYGELVANNSPNAWPAYGSEADVPWSGQGQLWPVALANQAILDGNWTPTLRSTVINGTGNITADLIVRVWVWNSISQTATKYGVLTKTANTITSSSTNFVFSAAGLGVIAGGVNDYLAFDVLANITANSNPSNTKLRINFSSSTTQGNANGQIVAPDLAPARIIPMVSALQGTFTRTIPMVSSLAYQRTIPMTSSLSGYPRRIIPMTSSVCGAALATPYVQPIANSNYMSASGPHLVYRGEIVKLYGATIYLSTQGGANTWLTTDASSVLNTLLTDAYNNGLSMIRITDFWDGGHTSAMDLPQLWANIDYCVTRAQQLGMFVMMDISAYKNVIVANALDPTVAANWTDFLTFVGYHYRNTASAICWYNLLGEPSVPTNQAGCNALATFYGTLCNTIHTADNGTHLIEAGGLTHMNTVVAGLTDPTWWYQIYTLANNNICGYKTYSANDLAYLSTIRSIMTSHTINKPLANNEFGAQQEQGDQVFPAFTNTLNMTINIGDTITALTVTTTIAQSILAGTIIAVSGTENFVVATTTSSGTSLPVTSVTAQKAHVATDSVSATGFADIGHSLGDTVYNFYSAVLGLTTTIKKWNNTPRTLVATSVIGGDQAGTVSYVVWNLGYQIQAAGYDVSANAGTSPLSWALYGAKSRLDGYQPIPPSVALTISIGGTNIIFDESTFTINYKENEAWRAQFTVLDYSGNQIFPYRSKIKITDYTLGILFTGFLIDDIFDKSNAMHDVLIEHKIDCIGNESKAMKRTSNRLYTVPFPAAQGVIDALNDTLVSEGVSAKYALSEVNTQALWNAGTLSGAIGAANLPGGDLELSSAGSTLTIAESTTSDFASGTLTDVEASSNALTLQSYDGLSMTGTCAGIGLLGNAFLYWNLYGTNTSQSHNWQLEYTMWIDPSSPDIMSGVDIVYTDGTTLRDYSAYNQTGQIDQHGIGSHPKNDLSGWANGQWYYRTIDLTPFTGKTINYVALAFEGDKAGNYGTYVQSCKLTYLGSTVLDVLANYQGGLISNQGYSNLAVNLTDVYAQSGNRVSSSHSLTSVGIYQSSLISWIDSEPTGTSLTLSTSFDAGATWQTATNKAKIGIITAGTSLNAKTLLIKEAMAISGNTPLVSPSLTQVAVTIVPSYSSTQTDVEYTRTSDADFNLGTLTDLVAATNSGLGLNGFWRNWANSDVSTLSSDQTVYGSFSPSQILYGSELEVNTNSGGDLRVKMVGAGQWQDFTASVIVQIPNSTNASTGMVYRTTGWQNANDTYAYTVSVSEASVQLGRGTNTGSGGGSFTSIATAVVSLTANNFYTLKVVVSGNSHKVYVDDVQYISATDSTYTAAGYIGLRLWNTTGGALGTYYGSFAVLKVLTGTYVSENLSLNAVGTVGTSRIFWQDTTPGTSTILFETSIDGKSTWQTATYGQEIVGLSPGTNVAGLNLNVRITLTDLSEQDQPVVTGYTAWITSQFSSSGSYISPSLSLATVGQVGNTLVSWAGLEPTNTTILADTTIDNAATWQTNVAPGSLVVAGSTQYAGLGTIGNIVTQPSPTLDGFSTDTSANYTQNHGSGGSNATWTPDTTNTRVTGVGGTQAFYAYTAISSVNMDVLCDMTRSDAGGLVWCYSDATHYYSVVVGDSQASTATPNTITLYRNGVSVASATIAFTRGLVYRVRASISAGVINVSFDGTTLITYTDASPLVTGKAGLFNNGGTSYFIGLWIQPLGDDVTSKNVKARIRLTSTDPTVTPQVQSLSFGGYGPQINTGTLIPSADYRQTYLNANLDDMAKQSNYGWHIDQLNAIYFTQAQARPAPWVLQSNSLSLPSDLELDSNLAVETLGDLYRNRQVLKGVINSAIFPDSFVGDGFATSFTLRYPIAPGTFPTITLNGATQTIGLKGTSGSNWYYAANDPVIAQDTSASVPLTNADMLTVSYTGTFTDTVTRNNTGAQTALALVEGGTGIIEAIEDVSSKNMSYNAAVTYGDQLLAAYCITGRSATFKTYRNGLAVGQMLPAWIPEENLNYAQLLIHQIDLYMQTQPNNTVLYNYIVQASELPALASWSKLVASGFKY